MLYEIMKRINNFFIVDSFKGTWTIEEGRIALPFVQKNQYFRVYGSVFNDGVYKYTDELTLSDETFNGVISTMAVPKDFLALVDEIQAYQSKYSEQQLTPFTSENFADYSYTKATNSKGEAVTWYDAFRNRLNCYRRL